MLDLFVAQGHAMVNTLPSAIVAAREIQIRGLRQLLRREANGPKSERLRDRRALADVLPTVESEVQYERRVIFDQQTVTGLQPCHRNLIAPMPGHCRIRR